LNIPENYKLYTNFPVSNLALASGSGYEMFRMFQHAHAINPLKTVIIGLDESFGNSTYTNFDEDRFIVDKFGYSNMKRYPQYIRDVYNSVLSIDAIRASVSTIKKQANYGVKNYSLEDMKTRIYNAGGHHQLFVNLENSYMANLKKINSCKVDSELPNSDSISNSLSKLKYFKTMIETAYRDDIQFKIFFSPVHARFQEIYCIKDSGQSFENFKFSVVTIVEFLAKKYNKKPFLVMDFSGYNSVTTEILPSLGDKTTLMNYYWEGSHYTATTATKMLDKLLGDENNISNDDFGVVLHKSNLIAHFERQRKLRLKYQNTHKFDIEEIHKRAVIITSK